MSIPIPAGTSTGEPLRNTSRWACTWNWSVSAGSGVRPAFRVRSIGLGGAGHGTAPCAGAVAGGTDEVDAEVAGFFDPDEHAPRRTTVKATAVQMRPMKLATVVRVDRYRGVI